MKTSDFDYQLPKNLIAKEPLLQRDHSRLLIVERKTKKIFHKHFYDLPNLLNENDVLVLNETKVNPARLVGEIKGHLKKAEILLIDEKKDGKWEVMAKPGKKFQKKSIFFVTDEFFAHVEDILPNGHRIIQWNVPKKSFEKYMEKYGNPPFPPYIRDSKATFEQYQTMYAKKRGSIAAPTAGLHFTENLLNALKKKGIQQEYLTLHVGIGTFQPVQCENIEDHTMHEEKFELSKKTAESINHAKDMLKKRIIAVGTTTLRVLESCSDISGKLSGQKGETKLFIYQGYTFRHVDALITNFHLPKSTLLMLISAFAGKTLIDRAYKEAIKKKYRFYSFGDAMLIL